MYTFLFLWKFSASRAEISISIIYFLKHASLELLFRNCTESHHSPAPENDILHCGDIEVINVGSGKNKVGNPLNAWRCLYFQPFSLIYHYALELKFIFFTTSQPNFIALSTWTNWMKLIDNFKDLLELLFATRKSNSVFGWCLQKLNHQNGLKTLNSSYGQTSL